MTSHRQLVEMAYHEAGHAVAAIDLDLPFTEAVVKRDGSGYVGAGSRRMTRPITGRSAYPSATRL